MWAGKRWDTHEFFSISIESALKSGCACYISKKEKKYGNYDAMKKYF